MFTVEYYSLVYANQPGLPRIRSRWIGARNNERCVVEAHTTNGLAQVRWAAGDARLYPPEDWRDGLFLPDESSEST